jgi:hypothetical protein
MVVRQDKAVGVKMTPDPRLRRVDPDDGGPTVSTE